MSVRGKETETETETEREKREREPPLCVVSGYHVNVYCIYMSSFITLKHFCVCVCVCVCVRRRLCYNKIEMEEINAPARGPGRVTNHLIRGKREEPEL